MIVSILLLIRFGFLAFSASAWSQGPAVNRVLLSRRICSTRWRTTGFVLHSSTVQQDSLGESIDEAIHLSADDFQNQMIALEIQNEFGQDDDVSDQQSLAEEEFMRTRRVLNGFVLAASFGYAAYTILNIDHGMSRGWTQSEIAMRIPLDTWGSYESSLEASPVVTKTMINVIIYLLGDWLSQTVFQNKNVLDFDLVRVLRNGFIGLLMGPLVHEYYQFSDRILPVEGGLVNRVEKIFMDQTIYLTVKCSAYIAAVGLLKGDDWATVKHSVSSRIKGVVFTAWKFWPLVHCITYSVIPSQHRILWVNCVDLVWNAILASMSQGKKQTANELQKQESRIELPETFVELPSNNTMVAFNGNGTVAFSL